MKKIAQQFKEFDSNNSTLSSIVSLSKMRNPPKKNAVYTIVLFHIFVHFLVRIGLDHNFKKKQTNKHFFFQF